MNSNHRVPRLVLGSTFILLFLSILDTTCHFNSDSFSRINLISDLTTSKSVDTPLVEVIPQALKVKGRNFLLYKQPLLITNFQADTTVVSMKDFCSKLHDLKTGKKRKIRIAYFGDSMIEGDLLTQTLRKLLQQKFGGQGVGFVPITSAVSKFRSTVNANFSGTWTDENFKTSNTRRLHISGHLFRSENAWVSLRDNTVKQVIEPLQKSLLCGPVKNALAITVNGKTKKIAPREIFNREVLTDDNSTTINLGVHDQQLPVYGLSFESASGIIVDNFSFRGITGIELNVFDTAFLQSVAKNNSYDLIVLQYGVNMLFRPNEKEFSWYGKNMLPGIRKFRTCFKETEIILISTADRAFRYGKEYKSATGIDSLINTQARVAFETGCNFYNQFATMGGANSIVEWAKQTPSLANKDYIHPNHRGAEVLANYFFEAIMKDYEKYVDSLNK